MLRRVNAVLVSAILVCTGTVAFATPSQADTPGCVTKAEFRDTPKGMRIKRVHTIFDTKGRFLDGGAGGFVRRYRFCDGAAEAARTSNFKIIYALRRDRSNRVDTKYCGRNYNHRHSCFG